MVKFYVTATGLAAVSASLTDCHTNNGGCSHYCYDFECSCPAFWGLVNDGKNCRPAPGMVTTTCSSNTIKMTISSKLDQDEAHEWTEAVVGDQPWVGDACKLFPATDDDGNVVYMLEHGLEECGMTLEYVEETETLLFKVSDRN